MKVFVTGATGFVGAALVADLLASGHQVLGLARSDEAARQVTAAGGVAHRGDLRDVESLQAGAEAADGVIHTGFIHDFSRFTDMCEVDARAIEAMGRALTLSGKPMVVAAGVAFVANGRLATEADGGPAPSEAYPRRTEQAAASVYEIGGHASVVRLAPSVHGRGDHGFVPMLISIARQKGFSAFIEDGSNRWAAISRPDAASLFRLALERGVAGATYHGVAEQGVAFRDIAVAIGKGLGLPVRSLTKEDAASHFGWFTGFASADCPASSDWTQAQLGWAPRGTTLLSDLSEPHYFGT